MIYLAIDDTTMAPYSSTLAWKIPWTEEPGGLLSMGLHRVGHNWSDLALAAAAAAAMPVFTEVIFQFWEVTVHGGIPQLLKVKMLWEGRVAHRLNGSRRLLKSIFEGRPIHLSWGNSRHQGSLVRRWGSWPCKIFQFILNSEVDEESLKIFKERSKTC